MKKFTLFLGLLLNTYAIVLHGMKDTNNQKNTIKMIAREDPFSLKYQLRQKRKRFLRFKKKKWELKTNRRQPRKKKRQNQNPKPFYRDIKQHIKSARDDYDESTMHTKEKNKLNNSEDLNNDTSNYNNSENSETEREEYGSLSSDEDSELEEEYFSDDSSDFDRSHNSVGYHTFAFFRELSIKNYTLRRKRSIENIENLMEQMGYKKSPIEALKKQATKENKTLQDS